MYGLDFIELRKEHYDFVVNVESMEKSVVKEFINVLRSKEFKYRMSMLGGYEVPDDVGTIIK
jgi:putative molybdopterin biosynthesis protein